MDKSKPTPLVGVIMGSESDKEVMGAAIKVLHDLDIPFEARVVSAHRTPFFVEEYARTAEERGLRIIIAGAGGSAHLPGMVAAQTLLPVHGVPIPSKTNAIGGLIALFSIFQMPTGVPVATFGIGESGAANAALEAARVLALTDPNLYERHQDHVAKMAADVMNRQQDVLQEYVATLIGGE